MEKRSHPPSGKSVLSIDLGTGSVRAGVYSTTGELLQLAQQRVSSTSSPAGQVEQDPRAVLAATRNCLAELQTDTPSTVGIASQGSAVVCWDRAGGEALSPILSWQDRRGEVYLNELTIDTNTVRQRTGLPLSCHYGATKIRWCLEHLPAVRAAREAGTLVAGPLASFILFHLDPERPTVVDGGNASRTQLWNLVEQAWDPDLCDQFKIPPEVLPEGKSNCADFGKIPLGGGLVPVVTMHRDQQAALFADGEPRGDAAYVNLGTGAFVQRLIDSPTGPARLLTNRLLSGEPFSPGFTLEGTVHGAAGAISWLEDHLETITSDQLASALALPLPAGREIFFINGMMGQGSPYWRSDCPSYFAANLTRPEKLVAWMESIVFMLKENLDLMTGPTPIKQLRVSGGLSNLIGLGQRLADLTGLPCRLAADPEATLRGTAFLAAGKPQTWTPGLGRTITPKDNLSLTARYHRWQSEMARLP